MITTSIFNHIEVNENSSFKQNRIAVRKDEIFYGINSSVRHSKVDGNYNLLDTDIDFQIENLKINSSGTLLAVYGKSNLVVLNIEHINAVKQYNIAVGLFEKAQIKTLLWNTTAKADSNLIILTDDDFVRSFDLNHSFKDPIKAFNLTKQASNKKGLNLNSILDPVSIALGSNTDSLSSLLTLYVVNIDGDVFPIYPFLPTNEISATKEQVENLFNESVLLLNSAIDGDKGVSKELAINQLRFANTLWKQLPLASTETRHSNVQYYISNTSSFSDDFAIQGPFSIKPYPDLLYEDEATDIIALESGEISLLAITFKEYGFITLLPDFRITMKWQDRLTDLTNDDPVPILHLLKHEKSKSKKPTNIVHVEPGTIVLENNNNLLEAKFSLDLQQWDIKPLLTNATNYEGTGVIYDRFSDTRTRIALANSTLKVFEESLNQTNEIQKSTERNSKIDYKSVLNTSVGQEIQKLLHKTKNLKLYIPANLSVLEKNDENSLTELNSITNSILKNLRNYHKFGILLNYKLNNINAEFRNQITTTNLVLQKYDKLRNATEQISKVVERQERLDYRFNNLKNIVEKSSTQHDLALSSKENQWFNEISSSVSNFKKSLQKNEELKEQLQVIRKEIENLKNVKPEFSSSNEELNWDDLNSTLKRGKELLLSTANNLNSNLKDLNASIEGLNI